MKILHLCTWDRGGAGIAAARLNKALQDTGIESEMLVMHRYTRDESIHEFLPSTLQKVKHRIEYFRATREFRTYTKRPEGLERYSDPRIGYRIHNHPLVKEADIIHLHWINDYVDIKALSKIRKPIVWTLHDMNPFTGGCHYSGECERYQQKCGKCPQLGSTNPNDLTHKNHQRKQKNTPKQITAITPSKWLKDKAQESTILKDADIRIIPHSVPKQYTKRDREESRKRFNIPDDKCVILFVSQYKSKKKGLNLLTQGLNQVADEKMRKNTILVNAGGNPINQDDVCLDSINLGQLGDEDMIACYSAADVLAIPSVAEAFNQSCLESMACGTPVVGYPVGAIPQLIEDGKTGLLAKTGDPEDLANKVKKILENPDVRKKMGENAAEKAHTQYNPKKQAKAYEKLYEELTK